MGTTFVRFSTALVLLLFPVVAKAAGLARPNIAGARPVGLGGAYVAIADDPSAIWYNPAGLAQEARTEFLLGLELAKPKFVYDPASGQCGTDPATSLPRTTCARVQTKDALVPLPVVGFQTRFAGKGGDEPSRIALGLGFYNSYGGSVEFDGAKLDAGGSRPGVLKSTLALLEIVPALAYRVNEELFLGATFRMGIGLFSAESAADNSGRTDADISSSGLGVGFGFGVLYRPIRPLRLGLQYRSQLSVEASGTSHIATGPSLPRIEQRPTTKMPWPQAVTGGFALEPAAGLVFAFQLDWVNWSVFQEIAPHFQDPSLNTKARYYVDFKDTWAVHTGLEYALFDSVILRGGYTRESNAIPDFSLNRQYVDGPKNAIALGAGTGFGEKRRFRLDLAGEYVFGARRIVQDNSTAPPELRNAAPGAFEGTIFSMQLTGRYLY